MKINIKQPPQRSYSNPEADINKLYQYCGYLASTLNRVLTNLDDANIRTLSNGKIIGSDNTVYAVDVEGLDEYVTNIATEVYGEMNGQTT